MCKFFSAVVTRQGNVMWSGGTNSHEELIKKAGLKDDKLADRDFVRVELTPRTNKEFFSPRKRGAWVFKVDEEGTLESFLNKVWVFFGVVLCGSSLWVSFLACRDFGMCANNVSLPLLPVLISVLMLVMGAYILITKTPLLKKGEDEK